MLKKHLLKVPVVSMLAAIGVMAVSASAAQAKWLILVGTNSVLKIEVQGTIGLKQLLVPGLLQLGCHAGIISLTTELSADHKTLNMSLATMLTQCLVMDSTGKVNANCTADSPGGAANTVTAKGSGTGAMEGAKTFATLKSENFSEVEINGALCPLDEFDATISGSMTATLDNAESKTTTKTVLIDEADLFYSEDFASLHDGANMASPVSATVSRVGGGDWLIGLVGL